MITPGLLLYHFVFVPLSPPPPLPSISQECNIESEPPVCGAPHGYLSMWIRDLWHGWMVWEVRTGGPLYYPQRHGHPTLSASSIVWFPTLSSHIMTAAEDVKHLSGNFIVSSSLRDCISHHFVMFISKLPSATCLYQEKEMLRALNLEKHQE